MEEKIQDSQEKIVYVSEKPSKPSKRGGCLGCLNSIGLILFCFIIFAIAVNIVPIKDHSDSLKYYGLEKSEPPIETFLINLPDTTITLTNRMSKSDVIDLLGKPSSYSEGGDFEHFGYTIWRGGFMYGLPIPCGEYTIWFSHGKVSSVSKY